MFFKLILLGISLAILIFIFVVLLPILRQKYKLYKEQKDKKKKHEIFKKKMKELEIK